MSCEYEHDLAIVKSKDFSDLNVGYHFLNLILNLEMGFVFLTILLMNFWINRMVSLELDQLAMKYLVFNPQRFIARSQSNPRHNLLESYTINRITGKTKRIFL